MISKKWLVGGGIVAAAVVAGLYAYSAQAADLGGSCCADLEERLAELEATTARKGNRKVRLVISGEVSKAILYHDITGLAGADKFGVIDNPHSGTKLRLSGEAKVSANTKAGFTFELGFDETAGNLLGLGGAVNDMTVRHSHVWLETALGKVTVGRASTATDGIVEIDLANTNIASVPMSMEPLWTYSGLPGVGLGFINPVGFDGGRANIVRYDTPTFGGFQASASWGGGQTISGDDAWDAAIRYAAEFGGIRFAAGVGYRVESLSSFGASDIRTRAGSASMHHMASGLFLNGAYGLQDSHPLWGDLRMWHVRGGWARNVTGLGLTSIYGEFADHDFKSLNVGSHFWGAGVTQAIDSSALDLFVAYREYDLGGGAFDMRTTLAGARIRF